MKISQSSALLTGFYLALLVWWTTILLTGVQDSPFNLSFAFAYGLIPLIGGFFGLLKAKKWGLLRSAMGRGLFFFSSGLITWGLGEMIWSFYNFILQIEVPYPSWADASFILSWPLWTIGLVYLSFATGAKYGLRSRLGKLHLMIVPLITLGISYYLLIIVARQGSFEIAGGPLKIFFDIAYPLMDVIILTLAFLIYGLSFRYLGGRFKWPILITLVGIGVNFFADFGFSYTTTIETHYNGNWVDLLFTSAMFILSYGINNLDLGEDV